MLLNSFVISSDSAERAERSEALAARKVPYTLDPLLAHYGLPLPWLLCGPHCGA